MKKTLSTFTALACVGASAFADWTLVDNFDADGATTDDWFWQRASEPVNIQSTMEIQDDPTGADNSCFVVVAGEGGNQSFILDFGDVAPMQDDFLNAHKSTLFFRHLVPTIETADGPVKGTLDATIGLMSSDLYLGLTDDDASNDLPYPSVGPDEGPGNWNDYATIVRSAYGKIDIRHNGYFDPNPYGPDESGVWYNFWVVVDIAANEYEVYVQGGSDFPDATPVLITNEYEITNTETGEVTVVFEDDAADFRRTGFADIDWFAIRYSANTEGTKGLHNVYIDDIYVDNTAENLTNPTGDSVDPVDPVEGDLINIATRGLVGDGVNAMIAGFVVEGGTKSVLVQAVGPELIDGGDALTAETVLGDPNFIIIPAATAGDANTFITVDDWTGTEVVTAGAAVGATVLTAGSTSAAVVVDLPAGAYTVAVGGGSGVALVEVYDID